MSTAIAFPSVVVSPGRSLSEEFRAFVRERTSTDTIVRRGPPSAPRKFSVRGRETCLVRE